MQAAVLVVVLCALALLNGAQAEIFWVGKGQCPQTVRPMQNFDLTKFTGHWFENYRGGILHEFDGNCIQSKYTVNEDDEVDVKIALKVEETGQYEIIAGKADLRDNSATLNVTLPTKENYSTLFWSILDTDYVEYAVVYSCSNLLSNFGNLYREEAWILSRAAQISRESHVEAEKALKDNGLYTWVKTQQNCGSIV